MLNKKKKTKKRKPNPKHLFIEFQPLRDVLSPATH